VERMGLHHTRTQIMDYAPKGIRIILTHKATVVVVMIMMIRMTIMEEKEEITYCKKTEA
jgi:hypothetical protein